MKTIYNAQGESKTCDPVDAREHIATGRWFVDAPLVDAQAEVAAPATDATADTSASDVAPRKRGRK